MLPLAGGVIEHVVFCLSAIRWLYFFPALGSYIYCAVYGFYLLRLSRKDTLYTKTIFGDNYLGFVRNDRRWVSIMWYERLCRWNIWALLWLLSGFSWLFRSEDNLRRQLSRVR